MRLIDAMTALQRRLGLSDTAFVAWLGLDGLGRAHWTHLRAGRRRPSPKLIRRIRARLPEFEAEAIAALLTGDGDA